MTGAVGARYPPRPVTPVQSDTTRERLLAAAGPLFAEHGFRDTGVKAICDAAGCNVASISYHFGSKQDFYAAVLEHAHRARFAGVARPAADPDAAPRDRLAAWLRWWIVAMFDERGPAWVQTLIAREMVDPTPALDAMVERSIRPMYEQLSALVRAALPDGAAPAVVRACVNSVIGQALIYKHAAPVIGRLGALPAMTPKGVAALAEHVVAFSLGGIAAIAGGLARSRKEAR